MKRLLNFDQFINESMILNEKARSSDVKKVEDFLKKNARYDENKEIYVWTDAGVEFDIELNPDKITLFDGEQEIKMSYSKFIKGWIEKPVKAKMEFRTKTSNEGYSTKGIPFNNLKSIMKILEDRGIPYLFYAAVSVLDFEMSDLSKKDQEELKKLGINQRVG